MAKKEDKMAILVPTKNGRITIIKNEKGTVIGCIVYDDGVPVEILCINCALHFKCQWTT